SVQTMFQINCGDYTYNYQLSNDGTVDYFPLAVGNGYYTFTVFVQNTGTEFFYFLEGAADVQMADEKAPFLLPNKIVNYTPESEAVQFSYELAAHASTNLEVIQQVYYWIEQNISYDNSKVSYVQVNTDYLPDVDEVLRSKKGICYDYAALAAAMLRANGIPCQLIMGDANTPEGTVVHAWNMVWTEEQGWITVEIEAKPGTWERIDLTFASSQNAGIEEFIGDGSNYMDMYVH
ncbi:transglutaminase-like domain-containing protein, partial [Ruminococcaceae bacterium OttesenSCG-928-I18]|nr:transglutaminase-like domain-containing protein [Ruminococcaceae bacterium OttesenSCG-928-I18]